MRTIDLRKQLQKVLLTKFICMLCIVMFVFGCATVPSDNSKFTRQTVLLTSTIVMQSTPTIFSTSEGDSLTGNDDTTEIQDSGLVKNECDLVQSNEPLIIQGEVLFTTGAERNLQAWNSNTSITTQLLSERTLLASLSPTGRYVAYFDFDQESGVSWLTAYDLDKEVSTKLLDSTNLGGPIEWENDMIEIDYPSKDLGVYKIDRLLIDPANRFIKNSILTYQLPDYSPGMQGNLYDDFISIHPNNKYVLYRDVNNQKVVLRDMLSETNLWESSAISSSINSVSRWSEGQIFFSVTPHDRETFQSVLYRLEINEVGVLANEILDLSQVTGENHPYGAITSVNLSTDQEYISFTTNSGDVRVLNLFSLQLYSLCIDNTKDAVTSVYWIPDTPFLAYTTSSKELDSTTLNLVNVESREIHNIINIHQSNAIDILGWRSLDKSE